MKDQRQIVEMLKEAKWKLRETLSSLLPEPLVISVRPHDTGCQVTINASAKGLPTILVWYGSIWYSPSYEFNDRNWVLGFQPDTEFARPAVEAFFGEVERRLRQKIELDEANKNLAELRRDAERNCALHAYAGMFKTEG